VAQTRKSGFQISYVTITYRSVFLGLLGVFAVAAVVMYLAFPETTSKLVQSGENFFSKMLVKTGLASSPHGPGGSGDPGPQQAHFTNIDGTVRVHKTSTNTWINADYNVALEKGDVVQTSSEGIAKIIFADGTNYTVKTDSLIVVQENSVNSAQQTNVAVQVTTGTVDLATASMTQGSKSEVIVAGATASLASETSAEVQNDPRNDSHEILLKKGSGEVSRPGSDPVKLADYEKVSFTADTPGMKKTKEIAPPTLIDPPNMQPVFVATKNNPVNFSWTPMDHVKEYHIRVSRNPYFSSLLVDSRVPVSQIQLIGFAEGAYYWEVQSIGEDGKLSVESEKNRFTVIPKGEDRVGIALELDPFVQHGHIIEVRGRTESTARVMVNDQQVAVINKDGSFVFYTAPLPTGMNVITVTAQNARGGVKSQTQNVVIQ
jgi:hypothetical protein